MSPTCPSDLQLDAFCLAGRPADHPLQAHLVTCERCRARLAEFDRAEEVFAREVYPATVDAVVSRLGSRPAWWTGLLRPPVLAASAGLAAILIAALAVWLLAPAGQQGAVGPPPGDSYVGIKGELGLEAVCKRGELVFPLTGDLRLMPGDALRFVPSTSRAGYLILVSIDADGEIELAYPTDGRAAAHVTAGSRPLPGSIVLDASRLDERIFAVFAETSFDFETVKAAAREALGKACYLETLTMLPLDPSFEQASILLYKAKAGP
ncbi:MAG: hypothetical protein JXR96_03980 [Deltaproteobacteria bacterium]|nr:hypothetical protein [Deltaproteobacteria bacterium]